MDEATLNVVTARRCPQCDAPVDDGLIFCKNCGVTLRPPLPLTQPVVQMVTLNSEKFQSDPTQEFLRILRKKPPLSDADISKASDDWKEMVSPTADQNGKPLDGRVVKRGLRSL